MTESTAADRAAFEELFHAHSDAILGYLLRRTDAPEDGADALADTMLVAWRRIAEIPPGADARLWLFGVARNVLANQRRSSNRRDRLGERLRVEVAAAVRGTGTDGDERDEVVRAAIRSLPEPDREILLLTAWEDLEPHAAAVVMDITPATARSRLHRARNRLRRELQRTGWQTTKHEEQA
jgi:RNA polymerase sigma-70 factor (ECF subfamily)